MSLIYCFVVFSILGWIIEVAYRSVNNGSLIKPGFLKGPYLPLYGFGGLLILAGHLLLASYSLPVRALFYFVVLNGLEFATGVVVEKIFHIRLWDYSDHRFNIGGHVCLRFAMYWMLLATGLDLSLDFIITRVLSLYERLYPVSEIILASVVLVMIIDVFASLRQRIKKRRCQIIDNEALKGEFIAIAAPILTHPGVIRLEDYNHHFGKTRLDHVLDVAWMAFRIAKCFSLDNEATVRGALLHDLFYYDWLREGPNWHGIRHPKISAQNAKKVTPLSDKEQDIITKHMWPLTIIPPRYAESWVVGFCDVCCTLCDYLVPIMLYSMGRRKSCISKSSLSFPSYTVLKESYLQNKEDISYVPGVKRAGRSLNILLIDAQPREFPFTNFRTLTLPNHACHSGLVFL